MDWGLGLLRQARGNKGPEHQHSAPSFLTVDVMSPCSCCPASPSSHCTFPAYHNGQYLQTLTPSKLFLLPGTSTASRNVTNSIKKGGVVSEPKVSNRAVSVHLHRLGAQRPGQLPRKVGCVCCQFVQLEVLYYVKFLYCMSYLSIQLSVGEARTWAFKVL